MLDEDKVNGEKEGSKKNNTKNGRHLGRYQQPITIHKYDSLKTVIDSLIKNDSFTQLLSDATATHIVDTNMYAYLPFDSFVV